MSVDIKNKGFFLDDFSPDDWIFGGGEIEEEVLQPDGQWDSFLPVVELQSRPSYDTFGCVLFGTLNALEILLDRKYGIRENYSERFLGVIANSTPVGNSPNRVCEAIRKEGCIDDTILPFTTDTNSYETYFAPKPMSKSLLALGLQWIRKYLFNHDWLWIFGSRADKPELIKEALKSSPVGVSVLAWKKNQEGLYFKEQGEPDNHWCVVYGYDDGRFWKVFDSYDNTRKQLAWDYYFTVAKRFSVKKKPLNQKNWIQDLIRRLWNI